MYIVVHPDRTLRAPKKIAPLMISHSPVTVSVHHIVCRFEVAKDQNAALKTDSEGEQERVYLYLLLIRNVDQAHSKPDKIFQTAKTTHHILPSMKRAETI